MGMDPPPCVGKSHGRQAYDGLRNRDEDLVDRYEQILRTSVNLKEDTDLEKQVSTVIEVKLKQMTSQQWTVKWRDREKKVRNGVDRIVRVFQAFKDLASAAAHTDPIHAGLPFAGLLSTTGMFSPIPILEYQMKAACYFDKNTLSRFGRNLVEADDWLGQIDRIKSQDAITRAFVDLAGLEWQKTALDTQIRQLRPSRPYPRQAK
ncbi:hypothetical protein AJ79_05755 [Helicocarpus griseus UAMH5409]|uniref:NWD NACHT-NTPase N-terminal domain-containing protein n=1 Tax=Helicocarpus griseus UAMH5409 TaxID=1447875 RepID=A0A2B7XJD6_9EURO|nr:hypothetical protein AJ79_05755 [Helicocarpus griseus UAMH5409]